MKKLYQEPLCEVVEIEIEDILCGSPNGNDNDDQLSDLFDDVL